MKTIVAVIVYDRFHNIERWVHCWKRSNTENAELVIIHNDNGRSNELRHFCAINNIAYILSKNVGYDVGRLQDIQQERLEGFNNSFDYLLWATDDVIPMNRDFINIFTRPFIDPNVGVVAMEISFEVTEHVRTNGFCIRKDVLKMLQFPANPVTTKGENYHFEHRGGEKTLIRQVRNLGFKAIMVDALDTGPFWDIGNEERLKLRRWHQHNNIFYGQ